MSEKIVIDVFDQKSIASAIRDLQAYKRDFREKCNQLCMELIEMGAGFVRMNYSHVNHWVSDDGPPKYNITCTQKGNKFILKAEGKDVLFLEFGAGSRYGYGHPDTGMDGGPYGPGTYPTQKYHWNSPYGWWTPKGQHTYGNEPTAGMYKAKEEIINQAKERAERIFNG